MNCVRFARHVCGLANFCCLGFALLRLIIAEMIAASYGFVSTAI
jgi:hypothetical protein